LVEWSNGRVDIWLRLFGWLSWFDWFYFQLRAFCPVAFDLRPPITGYIKKDMAEIERMLKALL